MTTSNASRAAVAAVALGSVLLFSACDRTEQPRPQGPPSSTASDSTRPPGGDDLPGLSQDPVTPRTADEGLGGA
ncbi:hypothetical protein ACFYVR_22540 [Rhodococcus sp. NPDC003318]|uniref:hypothetical protein n=1 Tax=Rhodococcus sp. NPDC003318 TaxID=3364503 RepID=UPI0036AFD1E6